jgi:hypothetical protein
MSLRHQCIPNATVTSASLVSGRARRWSSLLVATLVTVCTTFAPGGPAEAGTFGSAIAEPAVLAPGGTSTVHVVLEVNEGVLPVGLHFELTPVFEAVGLMEFTAFNVVSGPITCDTPLPSDTADCVWANATIGQIITVDAIVAASSDANGSWFIFAGWLDEAGGGGYGFNIHAVPPTESSTSSTTTPPATTTTGPSANTSIPAPPSTPPAQPAPASTLAASALPATR